MTSMGTGFPILLKASESCIEAIRRFCKGLTSGGTARGSAILPRFSAAAALTLDRIIEGIYQQRDCSGIADAPQDINDKFATS